MTPCRSGRNGGARTEVWETEELQLNESAAFRQGHEQFVINLTFVTITNLSILHLLGCLKIKIKQRYQNNAKIIKKYRIYILRPTSDPLNTGHFAFLTTAL